MKKYLFSFLAFIALTFGAQASHIAGGDLQYVYIGDSTGVANQYLFILRLYRDMSSLFPMPNTVDPNICSTCFATQNVTLAQVGSAQPAPTLFDCVDPNAPGTVSMEVYRYKNVATLSGYCADFEFMTQTLSARNYAIDNLNLGSANSNLVIKASLNNMLGNNSSPKFVSEPVRAFCVGQPFNWKQSSIEIDGDSLFYRFIPPKGGSFGSPCSVTPYSFNTGWSYDQAIRTVPGSPVVLDPKTGVISFTPSTQEVDVLAIAIEEYRWDTVYIQYVKVGEATRDMQITVSPACSQAAQDGVTLDFSNSIIYPDPVNGLPTVDYTCLDSSVTLHFATKLDCSTISPDGTDFRLTAPTGQPIPVKEIISNCDVNNETDQLLLKLYKPLAFNGKYFLYSKMGNDGNTLLNKCGFAMSEFDTIQLNVKNCFTTNIDMKNVTIVDDEYPRVEWELDTIGTPTEPFPKYLVDQYKVFRSDDNGATYNLLWTLNNNYKQMWFNDQSLSYDDVDMQHYKYQIEVIVSSISAGTTRNINSIWLRTTDGQELKANDSIQWSHYPAWPNPDFTVYLGKRDGNGNWIDAVHTPPGSSGQMNPTNDSIYYMQNEGLTPGTYRVCAKAEYPGGGGPYEAWSNCLQFNINEPPPEPVDTPTTVVIPNVITPNADDMNDYFDIKNLNTWNTSRSVKIFNRWGKMVYQNDFYRNEDPWYGTDQSGKALADGVYFYVIEVYNAPSGTRKEHKGQVTIIGSTN